MLSFDIRITNSTGWGVNAFDSAAYVDVLLVNKKNYDIYTLSSGAFTVDHRYFFKRVNWVTRRDLNLAAAYDFAGDWYLVLDNGYTWDLDAAGVDPGPSARPPRGRPSLLTVDYTVDYVVASAVTQLTAPCGLVTLNKSPNPAFYYRLTAGSWELQFGIDSCATGVAPTGNVTSGPCPLIYYILDRTNFDIINSGDFQTAVHDAAIQPPPSGARFALNVSVAAAELFFVLYAKSSTLSAWYRVDKLGEMCGRALGTNDTCIAGTVGCACSADRTCNRGMRCGNNTCIACAVGDVGCSCTQAYTCGSPDLRCIGASLRVPGVCTRCDLGTVNCAPRPNATDLWERCDANLRPLAYGNADVCLQCPRGDINCRCGAASVCSEPTNLCNATTDICVTDPSKATTTTTPAPTTVASGTDTTTRFVVEPVETRGVDPQPSAAASLIVPPIRSLLVVAWMLIVVLNKFDVAV